MRNTEKEFIRFCCSNQKGASLLFVLITTFILLSLGTIIIRYSNTDIKSASKQEKQTSAYYIAEAGLEEAIYQINEKLKYSLVLPTNIPLTSFQGGTYEVSINEKSNDNYERIGFDIISIGRYEGEEKILTSFVRHALWPENGEMPDPLKYAVFAGNQVNIVANQGVNINGNVHGNSYVHIEHSGLLELLGNKKPTINGNVSSQSESYIDIDGSNAPKIGNVNAISMPQFDFDHARQKAIEEGIYINNEENISLSLLGISAAANKVIFIDGNLTQIGLDLLGINITDRTFVVNGSIYGAVSLGGPHAELNLIAKKDITFAGLLTGLQVDGILFSQEGTIKTAGQAEVLGYVGGQNIHMTGGLLSGLLGILTGPIAVEYNPNVFNHLPSQIGFKQNYVEVIDQKESATNE